MSMKQSCSNCTQGSILISTEEEDVVYQIKRSALVRNMLPFKITALSFVQHKTNYASSLVDADIVDVFCHHFVCLFVFCNWQHSSVSLYLILRMCTWVIFHISWRGNERNSYLMESLSTNSSKKADSMSNVWSSFGRSVNPGIFSAQPLDMSMEAVRRL